MSKESDWKYQNWISRCGIIICTHLRTSCSSREGVLSRPCLPSVQGYYVLSGGRWWMAGDDIIASWPGVMSVRVWSLCVWCSRWRSTVSGFTTGSARAPGRGVSGARIMPALSTLPVATEGASIGVVPSAPSRAWGSPGAEAEADDPSKKVRFTLDVTQLAAQHGPPLASMEDFDSPIGDEDDKNDRWGGCAGSQGPTSLYWATVSIKHQTSYYHKISQSLVGARSAIRVFQWLCQAHEIWQAHQQHRCRWTCQISERYTHFNAQSHSFATWNIAIRHLIRYWNRPQMSYRCRKSVNKSRWYDFCKTRTFVWIGEDKFSERRFPLSRGRQSVPVHQPICFLLIRLFGWFTRLQYLHCYGTWVTIVLP